MKTAFGVGTPEGPSKPITNPFGNFTKAEKDRYEGITLRSKRGDQTVEVELPRSDDRMTNFVVPLSPELLQGTQKHGDGFDSSYSNRETSITDREITGSFPQGNPENNAKREQIEKALGLQPLDESVNHNKSYLARIDKVKQLYRLRRYEAGLLEIDQMIREFPTNPKLYEMRGTLLARLGYEELALSSWDQALKLNPRNLKLKKFLNRRKSFVQRRPASR